MITTNNIKFSNASYQGVSTPATDDDASTNKYAEDGLNSKADKTEIAAIDAKLVINTNNISQNAADILLKADKTDVVDFGNRRQGTRCFYPGSGPLDVGKTLLLLD